MRIVFCGTPEFAIPSLEMLLTSPEFSLAGIISQPDRPRGRGQEVAATPVKQATAGRAPVFQPEKIQSDEARAWLEKMAPDAVVIIAYGQIVPQRMLALPRLGWINLHASLLPKYRGAAPINRAIANGETATGLTTMQVDAGMDTGGILLQEGITIGATETAPELAGRMAEIGAPLVKRTLLELEAGRIIAKPQDSAQASYAPRLRREEGRITWTRTATEIFNRMRGFAPWPGAYTTFRDRLCHVWGAATEETTPAPPGSILARGASLKVACGQGTLLRVDSVKLEGGKRISAQEFASGAHLRGEEWFK
ncbi:MAG TPA: methionyl-tRNA formyltransferase [Methylomirabilota bacterium]|nr:methionyl-tRNA formyltransferase [Methylomirabilota bacterium]